MPHVQVETAGTIPLLEQVERLGDAERWRASDIAPVVETEEREEPVEIAEVEGGAVPAQLLSDPAPDARGGPAGPAPRRSPRSPSGRRRSAGSPGSPPAPAGGRRSGRTLGKPVLQVSYLILFAFNA